MARKTKTGLAGCLESNKLFADVHLDKVKYVCARVGALSGLNFYPLRTVHRRGDAFPAGSVLRRGIHLTYRCCHSSNRQITVFFSSGRLTLGRDRVFS